VVVDVEVEIARDPADGFLELRVEPHQVKRVERLHHAEAEPGAVRKEELFRATADGLDLVVAEGALDIVAPRPRHLRSHALRDSVPIRLYRSCGGRHGGKRAGAGKRLQHAAAGNLGANRRSGHRNLAKRRETIIRPIRTI